MRTRQEFEQVRNEHSERMAEDRELRRGAVDVLAKADHYYWVHQANWLGEPVLQLPQDLFAMQEIIFRTRPSFIVETGVAWGGSLLFYSTLMGAVGGQRVIGVDIYIPDDLKMRINSFGEISDRISLVTGSSIDESTIMKIKSLIGDSSQVLVHLDSNHSHDHVLKELRMYSSLVGAGYYMVCGDTVVEDIPKQTHRPRPWGPGNSPKTALQEFLEENHRFEVDLSLEHKLLFTCNPGGYLRCCDE